MLSIPGKVNLGTKGRLGEGTVLGPDHSREVTTGKYTEGEETNRDETDSLEGHLTGVYMRKGGQLNTGRGQLVEVLKSAIISSRSANVYRREES